MNKKEMFSHLEQKARDFYRLSDQIWENAEVRFTEFKSCRDTADFLKQQGFELTIGLAGMPTALRAQWGKGKPVIGFLGEYDALPDLSQQAGKAVKEAAPSGGAGHGCGHHLLGVGSLIGALGLKYALEQEGKEGTIIFFGCPAEEGGSGKTFMAREGCFDELDCAFCWHPASVNMMPPGTLLANSTVRYRFTGKTSHAAAAPEAGRSALDALELMNIGIQFLREHIPSGARVHYAITDAGGVSPNIVQDHAAGLYQIRAPYAPLVTDIYERVNNIARGAALMTDTEVKIEFLKGTSNTVLIPALDEIMDQNLRTIPNPVREASDLDFAREIVKTQVPTERMPVEPMDFSVRPYHREGNSALAGSSDVGDVSWVCPVSQCGVAVWPVGTEAHTWQATACGKSDFAHRGMLFAGMVIAATALDTYEHPEILAAAKEQFRQKTNGLPYKCPMPSQITPSFLAEAIK